MALPKDQVENSPKTSWWAETTSQSEFYDRARHEYASRMWRMKSLVQSYSQPAYQGRMSQPSRARGAE